MDKPIERVVHSVRMGELKVARDGDQLRTLLGSCVGIALYDRRSRAGGLAHVVLPQAPGKSDRPGKYIDTAVPQLICELQSLVGTSLRLSAKIAGGARMFQFEGPKQIGEMNIRACEGILRKIGVPILAHHHGGTRGRKMTLDTATGNVVIEIVGQAPIHL
jgi:chemotaxis protein CheD